MGAEVGLSRQTIPPGHRCCWKISVFPMGHPVQSVHDSRVAQNGHFLQTFVDPKEKTGRWVEPQPNFFPKTHH